MDKDDSSSNEATVSVKQMKVKDENLLKTEISREENLTNDQAPKKNEEPPKEQILEKKRDLQPPKENDIDVSVLKVTQLRRELKKLGLSTAGRKAELQERLLEHISRVTMKEEEKKETPTENVTEECEKENRMSIDVVVLNKKEEQPEPLSSTRSTETQFFDGREEEEEEEKMEDGEIKSMPASKNIGDATTKSKNDVLPLPTSDPSPKTISNMENNSTTTMSLMNMITKPIASMFPTSSHNDCKGTVVDPVSEMPPPPAAAKVSSSSSASTLSSNTNSSSNASIEDDDEEARKKKAERKLKQQARLEAMRGKARNEFLSASAKKDAAAANSGKTKIPSQLLLSSHKSSSSLLSSVSKSSSVLKSSALSSIEQKTKKQRDLLNAMRERARENKQQQIPQPPLSLTKNKPMMMSSSLSSSSAIKAPPLRQHNKIVTKESSTTIKQQKREQMIKLQEQQLREKVLREEREEKERLKMQKALQQQKQHPLSPMDTYEMSDHDGSDSCDDSSDESDCGKPKKRVPAWAKSANLIPALERQFKDGPDRVDPETIFPPIESCNLTEIFGERKPRFVRRTSSGNWTNDRVTIQEQLAYKRQMGFK